MQKSKHLLFVNNNYLLFAQLTYNISLFCLLKDKSEDDMPHFPFFTGRKTGIRKRDSAVSANNDFSSAQSTSTVTSNNDKVCFTSYTIFTIIIHQTHYEKSDWSRAFNQFTIACELDMINVISAADITFIMSSSTSVWLLNPLKCSPQKQNG